MKWLAVRIARALFSGARSSRPGPPVCPAGRGDVLGSLHRDVQQLGRQVQGLRRAVWVVVALQVTLLLYQSLSR